ncbi:hypothetical protein BFP70_01085 [Thioclava sp. SK-1]|nr:DUF58 domain-containing protein [Thioclava sp. SK-1]OCX66836.1 hypothetical protein BFP70_01085 [Thioclava sp. SK-1]
MAKASPQIRALRRAADTEAAALPPLLLAAEKLARTVQMGVHGKRSSGVGEEFWQYRPVHAGDEARFIDWRRSGRSDQQFVREREWQLAQTVHLWVDDAASMTYTGEQGGKRARPTKSERARLLALALAVLSVRGGERVGLTGQLAAPRPGKGQILMLAQLLSAAGSVDEYGVPETSAVRAQSKVVMISDFFGDLDRLQESLRRLAQRGVTGVMLQVLDPLEEDFPFDGRTVFESMAGSLQFETRSAGDLRDQYRARLAERRERLLRMAQAAHWQFSTHHTGSSAQAALLWLHQALRSQVAGRGR